MAMGAGKGRFIAAACINVVVAANAGGTFSPFGDITTLMVWQKGVVPFGDFFALFVPALINWLVPATLISLTISGEKPLATRESVRVKHGGYVIVGLFLLTIAGTVLMHHFLAIPPFLGMMTGLGMLEILWLLSPSQGAGHVDGNSCDGWRECRKRICQPAVKPFDVFISMKRVEWDTLMFFYGIMLCVGGLGALGYLAALSGVLYGGLGRTTANILIGIFSAVVDNIPVMFAVLSMTPDMSLGQWLLVTLTGRCRRIAVIYRVGSGRGPHGAGEGDLYVLCPPEMVMGYCLGLCRQYRGSSRDEQYPVLVPIVRSEWVAMR